MAKIIEKAYDMTKKIARTIFLGSPSLFTSADLNRQIEALQSQINALEGRVSGISRWNIGSSAHIVDGAASIWFGVTGSTGSITVHGATFEIQSSMGQTWTKTPPSHSGYDTYFIVLSAPTTTVTYADDPTHEIAGAKFQDGTVAEAADQLVYGTPSFSCVTSPTSVANRIAILAEVHVYKDHCVMLDNNLVENFPITQKIYGKQTSLHITDEPSDGMSLKDAVSFYNRVSVPIGTILPFYGDLTKVLPYGWIPCVALISANIGSSTDFASKQIVTDYKALYGNSISFEAVRPDGSGSSMNREYYRISNCLSTAIPDLTHRFLTGAAGQILFGHEYAKGAVGGEDKHVLGMSEMPKHNHDAINSTTEEAEISISGGGHKHTLYVDTNGSLTEERKTLYETESTETNYSKHNGMFSANDGTHSHSVPIKSAGSGSSHENRPPYHAVYYIMRVC